MKPPMVYELIRPSTQSTSRMTAIVQSTYSSLDGAEAFSSFQALSTPDFNASQRSSPARLSSSSLRAAA